MSKSVTGTLELQIKFSKVPDEMDPADMEEFIDEMCYQFEATIDEATVTDTKVLSFYVTSVKAEHSKKTKATVPSVPLTNESEGTQLDKPVNRLTVHHLNRNSNQVDFSCRIWLDPEEINIDVWVHKLKVEGQYGEEWVREEFSYLSLEELYDMFKLPYNKEEPYSSGCYQILAAGTVKGWKDQDTPNGPGEHNSEMEINSSESTAWVPDPIVEDNQSNTVEQ